MPKKIAPRIESVRALAKPFTLEVAWIGQPRPMPVDITTMIQSYRIFTPLRTSPARFAKVSVGEHGADVVWSDDMDMASDTLWRLAQEQAGHTLSATEFRAWRERQHFTLEDAARMLDISRRMIAYYEDGTKRVPRVVSLATKALDIEAGDTKRPKRKQTA
jgi:DNA-binding transcriptional regulator YiaG